MFQRDVQLPDRNFTVALRNLLLNVRVTTEKEEKNGVYFLPEPEGQLPVRYVTVLDHQNRKAEHSSTGIGLFKNCIVFAKHNCCNNITFLTVLI